AVHRVVAAGSVRRLGYAAEAGEVSEQLLVQRPRAARPDHRAVVEADRREWAADLVDDTEQVAIGRAPDVLVADLGVGPRCCHASRSRDQRAPHLVRPRVALGDEPRLAALAVVPPFALQPGDVVPEIDVVGEVAQGRSGAWTAGDLTLEVKLVHGPRPAVR